MSGSSVFKIVRKGVHPFYPILRRTVGISNGELFCLDFKTVFVYN